jgi:hypothetical protein
MKTHTNESQCFSIFDRYFNNKTKKRSNCENCSKKTSILLLNKLGIGRVVIELNKGSFDFKKYKR